MCVANLNVFRLAWDNGLRNIHMLFINRCPICVGYIQRLSNHNLKTFSLKNKTDLLRTYYLNILLKKLKHIEIRLLFVGTVVALGFFLFWEGP